MTIYHGTDAKSAEKILASNVLVGSLLSGPGVCLNVEQAVEYAERRALKVENSRRNSKVIIIEGLPQQLLNNATKSELPDTYSLNDELGHPALKLPFTKVKIMSIRDAEALYTKKERKTRL